MENQVRFMSIFSSQAHTPKHCISFIDAEWDHPTNIWKQNPSIKKGLQEMKLEESSPRKETLPAIQWLKLSRIFLRPPNISLTLTSEKIRWLYRIKEWKNLRKEIKFLEPWVMETSFLARTSNSMESTHKDNNYSGGENHLLKVPLM